MSFIKIVGLLSLAGGAFSQSNAKCRTPNGEVATCVPLSSCKVIQDAIFSYDPTAADFARDSQCGYNVEPIVCCGTTGFPVVGDGPPESPLLPGKSVCGKSLADNKIMGGELSQIGEFPWMVLLGYVNSRDNSSLGFKCGGTLINERYVLTAAHCVRVLRESGLALSFARLGEWDVTSAEDCEYTHIKECADPVIDLKIEKAIPHKEYSRRSGNNDIALLRLEKSVNFTDYVRPICLPPRNVPRPSEGTTLTVAGWGATENGSASEVQLKVGLPIMSIKECVTRLGKRGEITDRQICAGGEKGKDSCQGDSGGPLMTIFDDSDSNVRWYQEGVVAWGVGCALTGIPGVYTRVAKYLNWILENMSEF